MRNDQRPTSSDQRPVASDQFVAFRVGAQSYALPITAVREIVRVPEITAVPQAPDHVAGVMNLRGRIIPVVDLRKLLLPDPGRRTPDTSSRILVISRENKLIGMLVDSATEVLKIDPSQIEASPKLFGDTAETYVTGVARHQGRLIVVLDADRLLPQIPQPEPALV